MEEEKTTLIQKSKLMQEEKTALIQDIKVMQEEKIAIMQKMRVLQEKKLAVIQETKVMQERAENKMKSMKRLTVRIRLESGFVYSYFLSQGSSVDLLYFCP